MSCTTPLLPHFPCHLLGLWRPVSRGCRALSPPLFACVFTTPSTASTVRTTLSPMLQIAGTRVRSRTTLFNRPRSISPFCSIPLEAAKSDSHTVTDSLHGHSVSPSSFPSGLLLLFSYSHHPLPWLAPYSYLAFPVTSSRSEPSVTLSCRLALSRWRISTPCGF